MRVLFWSELFWPYVGGAEVFGSRLLPALQERGYQFAVLTSHDFLDLPDEEDYRGIPVYRLPLRAALTGSDPAQAIEMRRRVATIKRRVEPALCHINGVGATTFFWLHTLEVPHVPLLIRLNQQLLPSQTAKANTILSQALRAADWVTGVSAAVLDQARGLVPEIIPRSSVVYSGLQMPAPEPRPLEPPRLLCLGRLVAAKGFDLALRAFAVLARRFPGARLVLAGDGIERAALEHQASELAVSGLVDFVGGVAPEEVPALLNAATVVVMPSRREGLPIVAIQAALMARPVVGMPAAGMAEAVVHQQTGLLVEPENSDALASAIAFLLDHPEVATRMGEAARRRALDVFSWERCVNAYDSLYRNLAKTSSA